MNCTDLFSLNYRIKLESLMRTQTSQLLTYLHEPSVDITINILTPVSRSHNWASVTHGPIKRKYSS